MKKKIIAALIVTGLVAGLFLEKGRHMIGRKTGKQRALLSDP